MPSTDLTRCAWLTADPLYLLYHDTEWGVPVHDDRRLFEFLILEGAQAGLSWLTVLKKQNHYRTVFDDFDPAAVAAFDDARQHALLQDPGIIRNRAKVAAAVDNARATLEVQAAFGSLDRFLWQFVDGVPLINYWRDMSQVPAETDRSRAMSRELRRRGFRFVGPTICYAFMQATGMVNDHTVNCFRHAELTAGRR